MDAHTSGHAAHAVPGRPHPAEGFRGVRRADPTPLPTPAVDPLDHRTDGTVHVDLVRTVPGAFLRPLVDEPRPLLDLGLGPHPGRSLPPPAR